jgi:hypothetical protein
MKMKMKRKRKRKKRKRKKMKKRKQKKKKKKKKQKKMVMVKKEEVTEKKAGEVSTPQCRPSAIHQRHQSRRSGGTRTR